MHCTAPHCRHGLHEDLFNHFVDHLLASCDVVPLNAEQVGGWAETCLFLAHF